MSRVVWKQPPKVTRVFLRKIYNCTIPHPFRPSPSLPSLLSLPPLPLLAGKFLEIEMFVGEF